MPERPILDELRATEDDLRGIRAPRSQGNGYNWPGGGRKLQERIDDARKIDQTKGAE